MFEQIAASERAMAECVKSFSKTRDFQYLVEDGRIFSKEHVVTSDTGNSHHITIIVGPIPPDEGDDE